MIHIDLLPQEKKDELKRKKIFRTILHEEFLFLLPIIVLIVIVGNVYYLIETQFKAMQFSQSSYQAQDKYQQLSSYEEKFSQTNNAVSQLSKIQTAHFHWENLFTQLSATVPDNITITEISTKNYQVFLTGKAKTRDNLLDFKNKLDANNCFQNINVPLSDLVTKQDVDFQMDFTISNDCLTK